MSYFAASKWAVSSAVEHCFHTAGATGSIPVPPTIQDKNLGKFPQLVSLEFGTVVGQLERCR